MADKARQTPQIHFSPSQIPVVQDAMPVLKLGARALAPDPLVENIIRTVAPQAAFRELGNTGARAAYDGERLVAFANPATGEWKVFPLLEALKPGRGLAERAKAIAGRMAANAALFPQDGTQAAPLDPVTLAGARRSRDGQRTAPSEYLSFVRFQRQVNGLPVFGPGTRAMLAVAEDDSVRAFSHRWRAAAAAGKIAPASRAGIARSIIAQLGSTPGSSEVKVNSVSLGYYDSGRDFLQPVYRFEATVSFRDRELRAADRHVFGYVPIGVAPEPLPVLGVRRGTAAPASPPKPGYREAPPAAPPPGDPLVGRYVVRNDTDEWVSSANEFMDGLNFAQNFLHGPISFTDSQYFWAHPFVFTSSKDSFVNSVHIALNEVHGNWNWFSTRDNNDDGVQLTDIPADGYGGAAGVSLAYWILHSCEIIPTQTDKPTSFDPWWNIFNGLHAAVGYRTDMWIDDDVTGPFAIAIGLGAPVVSAWLNEVASNDSYDDGDTYHDGNRNIDEPMGRASAIAVCGHSDDTASNVGSLGRATCLTEWWFEN